VCTKIHWYLPYPGDGNVVNDKRFIALTLDISTDSGDIRFNQILLFKKY